METPASTCGNVCNVSPEKNKKKIEEKEFNVSGDSCD